MKQNFGDSFGLTEKERANNPADFWKGFLGQKVTDIYEKIKKTGNVFDPLVEKALDDSMKELPKSKADFISREEILRRALELYAKENGGFPEEKLKIAYIENLAHFLADKLHSFEFDDVDRELQKEIDIRGDILSLGDTQTLLRDKFYEYFGSIKTKEMEEEMNNPKSEE